MQEPAVVFLSYLSVMCNLPLKGEKPLHMKIFLRPRLLVFLLGSVPSIAPLWSREPADNRNEVLWHGTHLCYSTVPSVTFLRKFKNWVTSVLAFISPTFRSLSSSLVHSPSCPSTTSIIFCALFPAVGQHFSIYTWTVNSYKPWN